MITQEEFMRKIAEERATYQKILNPTKLNICEVFIWDDSFSERSNLSSSLFREESK